MTEPSHAVFLSYASQDAEAAQRICESLRAAGIEVFLDQSELRGGDAWDQKIRREIHDCALFIPVISSNTTSRHEGYFRLEWDLADQRSHMMARNRVFVVPVCLDSTPEAGADVPESFQRVQWTRLPAGVAPPAFVERVRRLLSPDPSTTTRPPASPVPAVAPPVKERVDAAATKPSIVVLPFNNISGDAEQEYFSDGITEDIITDLSKLSGLFVIARNTAFSYKGKHSKVLEISQELGVSFVLEGSVRKAGSRVRVTGQLVDGKHGGHVWADRYDRDLTDIFAIQDEITHAIVEQLKVTLLPQEKKSIGQAPTDNVEAYTYYLRGRQFFHRHSKFYYQMARRMFAKAVELDPMYARAYAGIADCDSFLFVHYHADVALDSILATSTRALELEAGLAEAHASRAFALSLVKRNEEAMAEFEQAIRLDPNSFEAHYFYARACYMQNKLERAAELFERAAEIKPDDYQALALVASVHRALERHGESLGAARKAVERAESVLINHPENARPAYLGALALIVVGERDRAREWLSRALAIDPDDEMTQYNVACGYCLLGEFERSFDVLERLLPHSSDWVKSWMKSDSDLYALRNLPRYQKVRELIQ
jgi:adenylate cyclase